MSHRRRLLVAALALTALVASSGCLGLFGSQPVPDSQLTGAPADSYAWSSNRTATVSLVSNSSYAATYDIDNGTIVLSQSDGFGGENAISVSAVRYRYQNGTVINGAQLKKRGGAINRSSDAVTITVPKGERQDPGELAFTSTSNPKRLTLPVHVAGSYEVVLPPDRRVDFFLFGKVQPAEDDEFVDDAGRQHLQWNKVALSDRTIVVQYYLQRDLYIFAAIVAALTVVAVGGLVYYQRQISALEEQRKGVGLDVDTGDDDDFGGGPPGRP